MTIEVLYIAGAGRSGSTFLSLMLSQHERAHNIGQIRDLMDAHKEAAPCSCGRSVPDCAYWGAVVARLQALHGADVLEALSLGMAAFGEAAAKDTSWNKPGVRAKLARDHADFLALFGALYGCASAEAEGRLLVDSSKSVDLALALSLIPQIKLRVLNLVRDPRAVAVSWSKVLKRPQMLKRRTRNWTGRQKRLAVMQNRAPDGFLLLRYEDLTVDPQGWIAKIQAFAGLTPDLSLFTGPNSADISWGRAHLFPPANAGVLKARAETITVAPATSWSAAKNTELHAMAEEVTFPFAETLGYQRGVQTEG